MSSALAAAKCVVELYFRDEDPNKHYATNLDVQKMLYFCQAWSLALRGQNLFPEAIEGWQHGPVVPVVYTALKPFGERGIEPALIKRKAAGLAEEDRKLIEAVWSHYRRFGPFKLSDMTHDDASYKRARKGLGPHQPGRRTISTGDMQDEYRSKKKPATVRQFARDLAASEKDARKRTVRGPGLPLAVFGTMLRRSRIPASWANEEWNL